MAKRKTDTPSTYPLSLDRIEPFPGLSPERGEELATLIKATRIQPVSAISWVSTPQWVVEERVVADSMWYWIETGTVGGYVGDPSSPVELKAGDLFLLPRGIPQSNWSLSSKDIRIHTVHFYADAYGALDLLSLLGLQGRVSETPDGLFGRATRHLARCYAHKPVGWRQSMEAAIWEVLLYLLRSGIGAEAPSPDLRVSKPLLRLLPVFKYLDEHLHESDLAVSDLARCVHVSEVYLRKLFRQALGESPVGWLRRRRLERACLLLKTTDQPVKTVASRCGFNNLPFFHNVFKDAFSLTPCQFRSRTEFSS